MINSSFGTSLHNNLQVLMAEICKLVKGEAPRIMKSFFPEKTLIILEIFN